MRKIVVTAGVLAALAVGGVAGVLLFQNSDSVVPTATTMGDPTTISQTTVSTITETPTGAGSPQVTAQNGVPPLRITVPGPQVTQTMTVTETTTAPSSSRPHITSSTPSSSQAVSSPASEE
jgi:hypothetical protein